MSKSTVATFLMLLIGMPGSEDYTSEAPITC